MPVTVRRAAPADAPALAEIAALTFPLACPPDTTDEAKAAFIAAHLTAPHFARYLADPARELLLAVDDDSGAPVGYTMLVAAEPTDADVLAAITVRPSVELSKVYVRPDHHGAGLARRLVDDSLELARARGAAAVWLGVNQQNARANRFYAKCGFVQVGRKRFLVGDRWEDDFVRELVL